MPDTEVAPVDPLDQAKRQVRFSLEMARALEERFPTGHLTEAETWFYAQAFSSAFTAVMETLDNVAKQNARYLAFIIDIWKERNFGLYNDLGSTVRNKMQHAGVFYGLEERRGTMADFQNDTEHEVIRFVFFERRSKGGLVEDFTLPEWAVLLFNWWDEELAHLERVFMRGEGVHAKAEDLLGRHLRPRKPKRVKSQPTPTATSDETPNDKEG